MHAGLKEAFEYRSMGLDTIYFFSDGLPDHGEGLPSNWEKLSKAVNIEALCNRMRADLSKWNHRDLGEPVSINSVGFYYESPEVGAFLWALSREHRGGFVGMSYKSKPK